ncbi:MAG TPA: hypothetical protein VHI71_06470 [Actinomycetota bacterium]|nr:hypothetical protein [Actinomycetota bacterium]
MNASGLQEQPETIQRAYALFAEHKRLTDADLRKLMNRNSGLVSQLDRMIQLGYIRYVDGQVREPWQYEFVPPDEVLSARDEAKVAGTRAEQRERILKLLSERGKRGIRARDFLSPAVDGGPEIKHFAQAMAHVRRTVPGGGKVTSESRRGVEIFVLEKGTGAPDVKPVDEHARKISGYSKRARETTSSVEAHWIEHRKQIVTLARTLRRLDELDLWAHVSDDELETVFEEVTDLIAWSERVLRSVDTSRVQGRMREKIANLRTTNGKTPNEIEVGKRKAEILEERLRQASG